MEWIGVFIPYAMALVNVAWFPSDINIVACFFCLGLGTAMLIDKVVN